MVEVFDLHQYEHRTIRYQSLFTARGGAVVARRAHNPKVVGSNPTPATKRRLIKPVSLETGFIVSDVGTINAVCRPVDTIWQYIVVVII